jgi:hypothetical protein
MSHKRYIKKKETPVRIRFAINLVFGQKMQLLVAKVIGFNQLYIVFQRFTANISLKTVFPCLSDL